MTQIKESEQQIPAYQLKYFREHGLDFLRYQNLPPKVYQTIIDLLAYGKTVSDDPASDGNGSGLPKREDFDKRLEQLQQNPEVSEALLLSHPMLSGNVLQILRSMIGPKVGGIPFAIRHILKRK